MTILRGQGSPPPPGYLHCGDPACVEELGPHYHSRVAPWLTPGPDRREAPDRRPGFYYVSAIRDDGATSLVRGPYKWHQQALDAVPRVKAEVEKIDPRSCWYRWGTARTETETKSALGSE